MSFGLDQLSGLIGDPGPCPVCDEYDCTHEFYGPSHYRLGDSRERWQEKQWPRPPRPAERSTKGRRARRKQEDRAHHPQDDRLPGTRPEGDPCSSTPPPTGD